MSSVYHENRSFGEYGQMYCGDGVWVGLPPKPSGWRDKHRLLHMFELVPWWCCSYRHRNSGPCRFAAGRTLIDVGSSFIVVRASSTFIQTAVTVTSLGDVILDHWSEHSWHWWECSYLESNYVCVLIKTYMDFVFQKQRSFYFFKATLLDCNHLIKISKNRRIFKLNTGLAMTNRTSIKVEML